MYQTCLRLRRYSKLVWSIHTMEKSHNERLHDYSSPNTIRLIKFVILRMYKRSLSLFCRRRIVHVSFGAINKPCWLISASDCIRSPWLTLDSVFISPTGLCLVCFGVYAPCFVFFAGKDWVKSPNIRPSSKPCFHRTHVRNVTIWTSLCGSCVFRFNYLLNWPYKTTNVMHWILFIRQILLLSSTCFEYQVLIFRRT